MDDPNNWQRDETSVSFYNPLTKEITVEERNEENVIEPIVLQPMKMYTFPKWRADHIIKNIKDNYIAENNLNPITEKDRIISLEKEIYGT